MRVLTRLADPARTTLTALLGTEIQTIAGVRTTVKENLHLLEGWDQSFVLEVKLFEAMSGQAGVDFLRGLILEEGRGSQSGCDKVFGRLSFESVVICVPALRYCLACQPCFNKMSRCR